jgi:hypothetical protein
VRKTFTIPKPGPWQLHVRQPAAGSRARVVRDGVQVFDGKFGSLKRFRTTCAGADRLRVRHWHRFLPNV